jgi:hypothetical protein
VNYPCAGAFRQRFYDRHVAMNMPTLRLILLLSTMLKNKLLSMALNAITKHINKNTLVGSLPPYQISQDFIAEHNVPSVDFLTMSCLPSLHDTGDLKTDLTASRTDDDTHVYHLTTGFHTSEMPSPRHPSPSHTLDFGHSPKHLRSVI